MHATISSPITGIYTVKLYYLIEGTNSCDYTKPCVEIPARDFKHACAIVQVYNGETR